MGKFDGVLLCTDLDGTVLKNDKTVSDENLAAIEYFKSEGGLFTFITGRMPFFAGDIYNMLRPNAPIGCVNGGGLYDYSKGRYIWTAEMPKHVTELIKSADEAYPGLGIQVNTYDTVYFSKENETMKIFRKITGVENKVMPYDRVEEPIAKIVFGSESDDEILGLERLLKSHARSDEFDFIRSERTLYEILPKGVCKGVSITKLSQLMGIDINKTVAVGDYNNDISMFRAAKAGIAVKNACPEAISAADFVTVSNEEHAIARVIYDLAEGKYIF